ncbi:hypothetical protein BGZ50_001986 [Haplosporangium sp. Z 11]|nr:hypothetical protein BGZ50_001986 [Haplosporangium sp. Z 11]
MSFFKKDYSAYPQPVVVTPDPAYAGESISDAVAEAIDAEHSHSISVDAGQKSNADTTADTTTDAVSKRKSRDIKAAAQGSTSEQQQQQLNDTQLDGSSEQTAARDPQPKDTTRLADGIMSLLGPIVQEMDFNIVGVRKSQTELEKEIERLMAELQLFMSSSASPPEVEPAVQKLLKARRQIMTANSTLKAVQERVDRMHLQIERRQ